MSSELWTPGRAVHEYARRQPDEVVIVCAREDGTDDSLRFAGAPPQYNYLGASPLEERDEGFASVGDMGYLDEEGYLYLSDRRVDMIISGGANVFPAEVEAVISSHPLVQDVAVIGLEDNDLGRRVHAVVEPRRMNEPPDTAELDALCRDQLASYKVPRHRDCGASAAQRGRQDPQAIAARRTRKLALGPINQSTGSSQPMTYTMSVMR